MNEYIALALILVVWLLPAVLVAVEPIEREEYKVFWIVLCVVLSWPGIFAYYLWRIVSRSRK